MATKKDGGCPPSDFPCVQLIGASLLPRPDKTIHRSQPHYAPCSKEPQQPVHDARKLLGKRCGSTRCCLRDLHVFPRLRNESFGNTKMNIGSLPESVKMHHSPKTPTRTDLWARRRQKLTVCNRKFPCLRESLIGSEVSRASTAASCTTLVGTSMDSSCSLGFISYCHKDNISKESLQVFFIKNEQTIITSYVG